MKKKPQRMCVSCKTKADKKDLLRIVLQKDGEIAYDPTGRLPGRGSYLCRKEECIMIELKAKRLAKTLKHQMSDDELKQIADKILEECRKNPGGEGQDE